MIGNIIDDWAFKLYFLRFISQNIFNNLPNTQTKQTESKSILNYIFTFSLPSFFGYYGSNEGGKELEHH